MVEEEMQSIVHQIGSMCSERNCTSRQK
jgi:hypothetical protein